MSYWESHKRTFLKTITWKVLATTLTFSVTYFFTGHFYLSFGLAVTSAVFGLVLYYIHERIWNAIQWGRHHRGR
ncbi:MAG: DUF2061 domain-containing protein [Anaplasmataceae bacterium]|nr:DUF2061 domain-containing protein [Anaplasmataceae bacterium]